VIGGIFQENYLYLFFFDIEIFYVIFIIDAVFWKFKIKFVVGKKLLWNIIFWIDISSS